MRYKFKLFYFLQYLPVGIFSPFFALYLMQKDFSGGQIGLLLGSMPVVVMVLQPVWSYLSDLLNTRKWILFISSVAMSISILGIGHADSFLTVWVWVIIFAGFGSPLAPISNAIVLDYLEKTKKLDEFGLLRLWGSMAFAVSSMILGSFFVDNILSYFTWILSGLYLINGLYSMLLPDQGRIIKFRPLDGLLLLPKNPNFAVYLFGSVFIGATISISLNYQTIFMNILGSPAWLLGVTIAMQAILEVPLMMLVPRLSKRFSWSMLIIIGAIALPIRWFIYIFVQKPGWVAPTQLLHSLAVVSFMVVGVSFIDKRINNQWRATSQGLYTTAMGGIGSGLGLYLAGYVMELFDIRAVWVLNLILGMLGLIFISLALNRFKITSQKKEVAINSCQTM